MKIINIEKQELKSFIEKIIPDFGSSDTAIYIQTDGTVDVRNDGESMIDWYPLLTVSGMGDFVDENNNYPSDDNYDLSGVAEYIISEGLYDPSITVVNDDGSETDYSIEIVE